MTVKRVVKVLVTQEISYRKFAGVTVNLQKANKKWLGRHLSDSKFYTRLTEMIPGSDMKQKVKRL